MLLVIWSSQISIHAPLSINIIQWQWKLIIITVIIYLVVPYYLDIHINFRANICINTQPYGRILFIKLKPTLLGGALVIHNNSENHMDPWRQLYNSIFCPIGYGWQVVGLPICSKPRPPLCSHYLVYIENHIFIIGIGPIFDE